MSDENENDKTKKWWVYVIQSQQDRGTYKNSSKKKPGFFYVGCTTDPARRLREHNGELTGGGKYTAKHRPWEPRALFGPYKGRANAMSAEWTLKHTKQSTNRVHWSKEDSYKKKGPGPDHPWVDDPSWTIDPEDSHFSIEASQTPGVKDQKDQKDKNS